MQAIATRLNIKAQQSYDDIEFMCIGVSKLYITNNIIYI